VRNHYLHTLKNKVKKRSKKNEHCYGRSADHCTSTTSNLIILMHHESTYHIVSKGDVGSNTSTIESALDNNSAALARVCAVEYK
jgi:hypothetical protein